MRNTPKNMMKEWSSEGYGMIKGALCTAEIKGVCEAGLVVEAAVRALVRGCSDVAAVGDASAPCLLLCQDRSSGALEAAGEGAECFISDSL